MPEMRFVGRHKMGGSGIQRYKCQNCKALFSARRKDITKSNRRSWFRKWVLGKMTMEEIAHLNGYSSRQLHRWFDEYLDDYPTWSINPIAPVEVFAAEVVNCLRFSIFDIVFTTRPL